MKTSSWLIAALAITCFFLLQRCSTSNEPAQLKHGDLLFQDLNCGPLCDAIEAVTEGVNGRDFSHCGMVVKINDSLKVVEAIGSRVQLTTLHNFMKRSGDTNQINNVVLGRLKANHRSLLDQATAFAIEQVDEPYDNIYLLDNGSWYCSELLYESFKSANQNEDFFLLSPMTYRDPESKDFFPAWVDYYEKLGQPIPEGLPGLNPGSISRSEKIEIIEWRQLNQS